MDVVTIEIPSHLLKILKDMHGCYDGNCKFGRIRSGMKTNGVCHCDECILNTKVLTEDQRYAIMSVLKTVRGR